MLKQEDFDAVYEMINFIQEVKHCVLTKPLMNQTYIYNSVLKRNFRIKADTEELNISQQI